MEKPFDRQPAAFRNHPTVSTDYRKTEVDVKPIVEPVHPAVVSLKGIIDFCSFLISEFLFKLLFKFFLEFLFQGITLIGIFCGSLFSLGIETPMEFQFQTEFFSRNR